MSFKKIQEEVEQKIEMMGLKNLDFKKVGLLSEEEEEFHMPIEWEKFKTFLEVKEESELGKDVEGVNAYCELLQLLGSPVVEVIPHLTYNPGEKYQEDDDYPDAPGYLVQPHFQLTRERRNVPETKGKLKKAELEPKLISLLDKVCIAFQTNSILEEKNISWVKKKAMLLELVMETEDAFERSLARLEKELDNTMRGIVSKAKTEKAILDIRKWAEELKNIENQIEKKVSRAEVQETMEEKMTLMGVTMFDFKKVKKDGTFKRKNQKITVDLKKFKLLMDLEEKWEVLEAIKQLQKVQEKIHGVRLKGKNVTEENEQLVTKEIRNKMKHIVKEANKLLETK